MVSVILSPIDAQIKVAQNCVASLELATEKGLKSGRGNRALDRRDAQHGNLGRYPSAAVTARAVD